MENSEEIAVSDQYKIQEIMNEISECREDERNSRNQIFTILAVVAAFIAAIITLLSIVGGESSKINFVDRESLALGANILSTLLLGSAVPWIANLGLLSTFRHFYLIELETQLSDLLDNNREFFHWESISTPVITFNVKHILPGYSMLYNLNMFISFISILTLAVAYILFVQLFANTFSLLNIIMTVWFWTVFIVVIFTIVTASIKSEEIYKQAKQYAKIRKSHEENHIKYGEAKKKMEIFNFIRYFLYPRIVDIQKNVFFIIGLLIGIIYREIEKPIFYLTAWELKNDLYQAIYVWFILDFLVYQARYIWNDLRGIDVDSIHPEKSKRKRLPVELFGEKTAILLAFSVIVFRLLAAFVLITMYGGALKKVLTCGVVIIFAIAGLYESAKTKNNAMALFALVPWGYSIRLCFGVISAWPSILQYSTSNKLDTMILLFVLLATAAFGEVFVSLTWCFDAVFLEQNGIEVRKNHYLILYNQVPEYCRNQENPLICKDSLGTIWNRFFCYSIFFLELSCISVINFSISEELPVIISILVGIITIWIVFQNRSRKGKMEICGYILIPFISVLECVYLYKCGITTELILYVALIILRTGYEIFFMVLRHSNYQKLVGFGGEIKKMIKNGVLWFLMILLGKNTYRKLFE